MKLILLIGIDTFLVVSKMICCVSVPLLSKKVENGLLKCILLDYRHCISQLKELKKADKFADFPIICPYAYAYVFWRKSLLKEEYFYSDNLCRTMEHSYFYRSPLIIRDLLKYFADQIVRHQMSVSGGIHLKQFILST